MRTFTVISCVVLVASFYATSAAEEPESTGTGTLRVVSQDRTMTSESVSVSYYKKNNIFVYRKEDGTFEAAQDMTMDLHYYRPAGQQICYISQIEGNDPSLAQMMISALSDNTKELNLAGFLREYKPFEEAGKLTYTPFIPDYIKNECADGFMYALKPDSSTGMETGSEVTILLITPY